MRDYSPIIDHERSRNSLGYKYQLICDNRQKQFLCINLLIIGGTIGNVINLIFRIGADWHRKAFLTWIMISMPLSLWLQFLFSDLYVRSLILGLYCFGRIAMQTICMDLVFTHYNKKVSSLYSMYQTMAYCLYGLILYPVNLLLDGDFSYCICFDALPLTLSMLFFLFNIARLSPEPQKLEEFQIEEEQNLK